MFVRTINHGSQRGFTFLEIMIVVVIIGLLAGISGINIVKKSTKSKIIITQTKLTLLKSLLCSYELDVGVYPTESEGLLALLERPSGVAEEHWDGPYADDVFMLTDAWHQPIIYKISPDRDFPFDLISKGPDRKEGTDDDITVWNLPDKYK